MDGVHSHTRHLYAILELAKRKDFENVYVHCFLDGRDTPPASAEGYIADLEKKMKEKGIGKIASICGRFYAMDRDKRYERTEIAYKALVKGEGEKNSSAIKAIEDSYQQDHFDEFIKPIIIANNESEVVKISNNDSVIFFNFRPDRARQLTKALVDSDFKKFETEKLNLYFVSFTEYDSSMHNVHVAFKPQIIKNTFGEYISRKGLKQLRIAETEKYAHVTFFFNGGNEKTFPDEDRILIPSPKVETYDTKPEMSASEITKKVIEAVQSEKYDSIILNYANPDMIGHTGNLEATIKSLEFLDNCIEKVVEEVQKHEGYIIITSDHGNAEQMVDYKTGEPHTAHTKNDVPLILVGKENIKLKKGRLCDIIPTMLELMEIEKPSEMTGESLIEKV